jgi:hypothetical protein
MATIPTPLQRDSTKPQVDAKMLCCLEPPRVTSLTPTRAAAVKVGRRTYLAACSAFTRPHLDSFEHDGTLDAIGMTIRGEPAFGRGSIAPRGQNDAFWHNALLNEPPQCDQKLARQGHDHRLASAGGVLSAGSKPLRQGAVLLEHEKSPRKLDHAPPNSSVAGAGKPFLPPFCAALVWRASEPGITRYGPSGNGGGGELVPNERGVKQKTGGRVAGTPNKVTRILKDALLLAAERAGQPQVTYDVDGNIIRIEPGEGGLDGYLLSCALYERRAFMTLLGRVMPLQINMKSEARERVVYESSEQVRRIIVERGLDRLLKDEVVVPMPRRKS